MSWHVTNWLDIFLIFCLIYFLADFLPIFFYFLFFLLDFRLNILSYVFSSFVSFLVSLIFTLVRSFVLTHLLTFSFLIPGGLLSFPQRRKVSGGPCGSDDGNLQVGWWKIKEKNTNLSSIFKKLQIDEVKNEKDDSIKNQKNDDDSDEYETVQPVFMDIWRQEYVQMNGNNEDKKISKKTEMTVIPRTALYVREKNIFGIYKRVYITRNFDAKDAETGAARDNYDTEFLNYDKARDIYYDDEINNSSRIQANRFLRIEDIPAWEKGKNPLGTVPHITSPLGGSLVLFDSVCLPHEVMETRKGERLVLAGWLHEEQQSVPNWMNIIS